MENRNGLLVDFRVDEANGTAERTVAAEMLHENVYPRRATVGADKGYDTRDFVADCRLMNVTPHVAANEGKHRRSAIDWRTRGQPGYAVSQRKRKLALGSVRLAEDRGRLPTDALQGLEADAARGAHGHGGLQSAADGEADGVRGVSRRAGRGLGHGLGLGRSETR